MLLSRIATAVVLIPLVVVGIIWLPSVAVGLIFGLLMGVGAWEWSRLLGLEMALPRWGYTLAYALLAAYIVFVAGLPAPWPVYLLMGLACLWWLLALYWLVCFPRGWAASIGRPVVGAVVSLVALWGAVCAVFVIHSRMQGVALLLQFFVLVWATDTGAYFAGRALGRHSLAPAVSPRKTREGAAGGIGAALAVAAIGGVLLGYSGLQLVGFVLLGGWIAVLSMIGDLTLSMFKRHTGIKDSGILFPGHGGVLDRLDSVLAAAPWFALGLSVHMPG